MFQLKVKVIPNASKPEISGWLGHELKVKVSVQPEKGKANKAVIDLLAKSLNVSKQAMSIESGQTSPHKVIAVQGIDKHELLARIDHHCSE